MPVAGEKKLFVFVEMFLQKPRAYPTAKSVRRSLTWDQSITCKYLNWENEKIVYIYFP